MSHTYIDDTLRNHSAPQGYKKVVIKDPFNNRDEIALHGKRTPGVYVFHDLVTGALYVGGSINLYTRVTSYFFPSIINSEGRGVYRYFKAYGYDNLTLTLFILPVGTTVTDVIKFEQFLIDTLKPDLNVDPIAGGMHGTHLPMPEAMRIKLRKERGTEFYVFDTITHGLLYYFDSIQHACDSLKIHRSSINHSLTTGEVYMGRFIFSTELLSTYPNDLSLSLIDLQLLIEEVRSTFKPSQPAAKGLLAENVLHPKLTSTYAGINEFARAINGDRSTIRHYLNGNKPAGSLYRKQWKLTLLS